MDMPEKSLQPLPYHIRLKNYLKEKERELWKWFSSGQARSNYTESLRMELLKSTYRLDTDSHPDLYRAATESKAALGLDSLPLTIYQAQHSPQVNASLFYVPGEGHLVLSGPILSILNYEELKAVLGHELAHYHLWQADGGEYLVTDRLLQTVAQEHDAAPSHLQSAQRFQLYTEIYADRGSFIACRNIEVSVAALVKATTGLHQASGASYLKQAEEIFEASKEATAGVSHPEAFIRAHALQLWVNNQPETESRVARMIESALSLQTLDLLDQERLAARSRTVVECLLQPKWFQTETALGHAKLFFPDFAPAASPDLPPECAECFPDNSLKEYLCFLLLDFAAVDPDLDDLSLAAAWQMSRRLGISEEFEKIAAKELKIRTKELNKLKKDAERILAEAEVKA